MARENPTPALPTRRRPPNVLRARARVLTSPKLAIALLVAVLVCCVVGVTVVRGARARELIFPTLWFNGLLVLLAVSSWRRSSPGSTSPGTSTSKA